MESGKRKQITHVEKNDVETSQSGKLNNLLNIDFVTYSNTYYTSGRLVHSEIKIHSCTLHMFKSKLLQCAGHKS